MRAGASRPTKGQARGGKGSGGGDRPLRTIARSDQETWPVSIAGRPEVDDCERRRYAGAGLHAGRRRRRTRHVLPQSSQWRQGSPHAIARTRWRAGRRCRCGHGHETACQDGEAAQEGGESAKALHQSIMGFRAHSANSAEISGARCRTKRWQARTDATSSMLVRKFALGHREMMGLMMPAADKQPDETQPADMLDLVRIA